MKNLIVYFPWSGNTQKLAKAVDDYFGFDTERIERTLPYSDDYDTCAYVEAKNECENHTHPQINELKFDANVYHRILLFFPIWWYSFPMPVATFIEKIKGFKGEVVLFENSYTNDAGYVKQYERF